MKVRTLDKVEKIKGFTLIELLVVVAIIALFTAFSLVAISYYRDKAKDARVEATLSQVRRVATMIYNDSGSYADLCYEGTLKDGIEGDNSRNLKLIEDEVERIRGSKPACYTDGSKYCVQSTLFVGGNYCVDSAGIAIETKDSLCNTGTNSCTAP